MSGQLYFLSSAGPEEALLLILNVVLYLLFIQALKLHVLLKRRETVFTNLTVLFTQSLNFHNLRSPFTFIYVLFPNNTDNSFMLNR